MAVGHWVKWPSGGTMSITIQTPQQFEEAGGTRNWRALNAGADAWFDTGSHHDGAVFVRRVAELAETGQVPSGGRSRLGICSALMPVAGWARDGQHPAAPQQRRPVSAASLEQSGARGVRDVR